MIGGGLGGVVVGRAVSSCLVGVSQSFWVGVMWELELPLPLTVSKRQQKHTIPLECKSAMGNVGLGGSVVLKTCWFLLEPL